jgi:hypothetical protein
LEVDGELDAAEISIRGIENIDSSRYRSLLTAGVVQSRILNDVKAESFRDEHVHLLLLCMRVFWRGEAADLKDLF